jgi:predicted transposase YbfD/YdcC
MDRVTRPRSRPPSPIWVRATWPERPDLIAVSGRISRGQPRRGRRSSRAPPPSRSRVPSCRQSQPADPAVRVRSVLRRPAAHALDTPKISTMAMAASRSAPSLSRARSNGSATSPPPRLTRPRGAATLVRVVSHTEPRDRSRFDTRSLHPSPIFSAEHAAAVVRGHWAIANSLPWTLNVVFNCDQSRSATATGATNMAVVRHFAINLVRAAADKRSIK